MDIDASLLREKYIIREHPPKDSAKTFRIEAPSTRLTLKMQSGGLPAEEYVVRTSSTHSCARIAGQIITDYERHGPFAPRLNTVDWAEMWDNVASNYARLYNRDRWFAIYKDGKTIFKDGTYHPFFDVIEKCDAVAGRDYTKSISLAEDSFQRAGKAIKIQFESNVALVAILNQDQHRCSMILRSADKTTTFNYTVKPKDKITRLTSPQGLSTSADFLEGVELAYLVGMNNAYLEAGIVAPYSEPDKGARKARQRINEVIAAINSMENRFTVRYRPERPDFDYIMETAEAYIAAELRKQKPKS